jgi:hypothetical protein
VDAALIEVDALFRRASGYPGRVHRLAASLCVVFTLGATPAKAEIVSTTGMVTQVDPPADVSIDQEVSASTIIAFDEMQDVPTPFRIDALLDASTGEAVVINDGTYVDSHLLHVDLPPDVASSELEGTVTFSGQILGLVIATDDLVATDDSLGAPDTVYDADIDRMLDLGNDQAFVLEEGDALYVKLRTDTALDQIRVLTVGAPPGVADTGMPLVDSGAMPPNEGSNFRGEGGCACEVGPRRGVPWEVVALSVLISTLFRRRR